MATIENQLASQIIKLEFGEESKLITNILIKKKSCSLELICNELELEKKLVFKKLAIFKPKILKSFI